ncbi:hypothetical protein BDV12DRAFT_191817 [Aspergillus spectabilis]
MSQVLSTGPLDPASPTRRGSAGLVSRKQKLIELRPKEMSTGSLVIVKPANPLDFRRQQHAQAQKQQRDRMKAALDRIAQIMEVGGVNEGTSGTKAELLETAVGYIQSLQGQIDELRGSRHATASV